MFLSYRRPQTAALEHIDIQDMIEEALGFKLVAVKVYRGPRQTDGLAQPISAYVVVLLDCLKYEIVQCIKFFIIDTDCFKFRHNDYLFLYFFLIRAITCSCMLWCMSLSDIIMKKL